MYKKDAKILDDTDHQILNIVYMYQGQNISVRKKAMEILQTNQNMVDRHMDRLLTNKFIRRAKKMVRADNGHMIPATELTDLGKQQLEILNKINKT